MFKTNPRCPECGGKLVMSKIQFDIWHCKRCNVIFPDSQIRHRDSVKNYNEKTGRFEK